MHTRKAALTVAPLFLLGLALVPCQTALSAEGVIIAGKVAARISYQASFPSLGQRAADVDKRLADAISVEDVGSPKMKVAPRAGNPAIFVGKTYIMTVYPQDARPYGTSAQKLAQTWAKQIGKLLPLAEPSIHMDNPNAGSELAREQARTAASANVSIPPARWAITDVVLATLSTARLMSEPEYAAQEGELVARICGDVGVFLTRERMGRTVPTPPHKPGACPQPEGCPACVAATEAALARDCADAEAPPPAVAGSLARRVTGGMKLMRMVDEARYKRDRAMIAYTIIKASEKALPPGPVASAR